MKLFGYARVSSTDQDLTVQLEALKKAGVDERLIFAEKKSGTTVEGRVELARCLALMSPGDTLVVMRLDRLMRNMKDYTAIVDELKGKGCGLKCTHEPIDASGPMGMLVMDILAAVAAFETRRRSERQKEGIALAKQRGVYKGGPRRFSTEDIRRMHADGMGATEIMRAIGAKSTATVYRALNGTTGE